MWTIDQRCTHCANKIKCDDRPELLGTLSPLTNKLNTDPKHLESPGDGIIIIACNEFVQA